MKDRQPWSVRGVAREARAKAARAAHRRHMTIGEWLTETVIRAADRDLGGGEPETGSANLPATNNPTPELAGALGALVQHLEKGGSEDALTSRIDRTEAVLTGRMEQIAAAMYGVMQTVERNAAKPIETDHRAQAIAQEQARIAEQMAMMASAESRRQEQMGAIADALTMLATKVDAPKVDAAEPAPKAEPTPSPAEPAPPEGPPAEPTEPAPIVFQPTPAPTRQTDPRAEEVAARIREAANNPPGMPEEDDAEPRRRGLLGRMFRRD